MKNTLNNIYTLQVKSFNITDEIRQPKYIFLNIVKRIVIRKNKNNFGAITDKFFVAKFPVETLLNERMATLENS